MQRKAMQRLIEWKNNPDRMPLIVRGARQVGKSWLVEEFGKTEFAGDYVVVNLESPIMQEAFYDITEPERIISILSSKTGKSINRSTLLFLDEIQSCPNALGSLKYFCEKMPGTYVVAAGSLLGISANPGRSFPVGKVEMFTIRPMDFEEFLMAIGHSSMAKVISEYDTGMMAGLNSDLKECLRTYLCVGGMPAAVKEYANSKDLYKVREIQEYIISNYDGDIGKHPPKSEIEKMRAVWDATPGQLAKDNRKFVYSAMKIKGGAARFMTPILWLCDYGLLIMVPSVSKPGVPLSAYADRTSFKLFAFDVGLLGAKSNLDVKAVVEGDRMFTEFKGALAEQYVVQELIAAGHSLYFWSAERGESEIDIIIECAGTPIPIEVKSAENLKSKSLKTFRDKYLPAVSVRTSLSGTRDEGWMINIPLYAISGIDKAVSRHILEYRDRSA